MKNKVKTGLDIISNNKFKMLKGLNVAVLANHATIDSQFRHLVDLLHESKVCNLKCIFGPEHGFRGELQDMAAVGDVVDQKTRIPVISLYGSTIDELSPTEKHLEGIDVILADLPDIGTRYYTFAQTLAYCMQKAVNTGIKIVVLDRPNPLGGERIEGSPLKKDFHSFCGYAPVPQRHGLTLGELASLMNEGFGDADDSIPRIGCELEVVKIENWFREKYFDECGIPWIAPSPNMPTLETAIVYPGSCLFEATNISEGRGTTKPFEFIGAPGINSEKWIEATISTKLNLTGAALRPISFVPQFHKFSGQYCSGLQIHITDRNSFSPLRCGLALIAGLKQSHPEIFAWRTQTYEFISNTAAIDLLYGSDKFRLCLDRSENSLQEIEREMKECECLFAERRQKFLLYP